jgi:hypothetical protein
MPTPTNIRERIREILNIISTARSWSPDMNPYDIATNQLVSLMEERENILLKFYVLPEQEVNGWYNSEDFPVEVSISKLATIKK